MTRTVRTELARPGRADYRVVTGHSLGGAVATLAAVHLRRSGVACDLYTYGAPRVGNDRFVAHVGGEPDRLGFTARVTNTRDIVAAVPSFGWPWAPRAYVHHFPEY